MPTGKKDFRLPQNVRPVGYNLTLTPDLKNFTFDGFVSIALQIQSPTSCVVMNAADLDVEIAIVTQGRKIEHAPKIVLDSERETISVEFATPLKPGKANISLTFKGILNDSLVGFYRSKYALPDGAERYMATTQLEAIDARRAFPCFDEPEQKATFDLTLIVPQDRTAISNMPVREEFSIGEGLRAVKFETTPLMSTYLLAFAVGDLEHIEGKTKNGTLMRVFATPGKKEQCEFALEVSIKLLEYFEDYFGIPYPLPKMDLLAVPDFEPGAMENWGLVTFREVALLFDPERSSNAMKQRITYIIAHEFAHMWFGDLVTMKWWNDLWLNESFATLMGNKAVAHLFPEWNIWEQFYAKSTSVALSLDGLESSHPIEVDIDDPHKIGQIFDAISYEKGASVLRMLENYLGEETFQKGVSRYLSTHQYGNAETQDLWAALSEASGENVAGMMDSWTKQMGYPILSVKCTPSAPPPRHTLTLAQKKFLYGAKSRDKDTTLWKVPFTISTSGTKCEATGLLSTENQNVELTILPDWIKINSAQTGFYRVQYSPEMQEKLCRAMTRRELSTLDRIGLANDAYALQRAGMIPATQYLDLVRYYRDETEYPVWTELSTGLCGVMDLLADEPCYNKLQGFVRNMFITGAKKIGWDPNPDEDDLAPMLRSLVLGQMANCGDQETIEEARQRFAMLCLKPDSLNPDLRAVVSNTSARYGETATYSALLELYRKASTKEEQMTYMQAMGQFKDSAILSQTLEFAMSDEVRHENRVFVISSVANNTAGRELAWKFFKDNHEELHKRYAHSMFTLGRIVQNVVSGFCTQEKKEEIEGFFQEHPIPEASMVLAQSLERIDMNIAWLARNRDEVGKWLK